MRLSASIFACCLLLQVAAAPSHATVTIWQSACSEDQVNNSGIGDGSTDSPATGFSDLRYEDTSDEFSWSISYDGLVADLTAIHVHGPASPSESAMPHFFNIYTGAADVIASGLDRRSDTSAGTTDFSQLVVDTSGSFTPSEVLAFMQADSGYTNIHSADFPMGEIRCNLSKLGDYEPQTKGQQKCLAKFENGIVQSFSKVPAGIARCMKAMAKAGGYEEAAWQACEEKYVTSAEGKLGAKGESDAEKFCTGEDAPDLDTAANPTGVASMAAILPSGVRRQFLSFVFHDDLSLAAEDPAVAGCAAEALSASGKCVTTISKAFAKCAKLGRQGKSGVSFVLPDDVLSCVGADSKGKIEKACGAGSALEKKIAKRCDGLTETVFKNGVADVAESVANVKRDLRCASCLFAAVSAYLGTYSNEGGAGVPILQLCDLADDGIENISCGTD